MSSVNKDSANKKKGFSWSEIDKDYFAYYGDEELGYIEFYYNWKKWVWNQNDYVVMSKLCIKEVYDKLKELENDKN